ncbi:hypothetical protein N5C60_21630 [Pseudomonas mosselii]|uniref:hypothetical protein n=1 Tax=Pseudomonas mosselii TaxID=78327 RepID=UPI0024484687|nr:hypothetical protein [Pseudomonas mosselii]MDH1147203.1 hypothetical protein [Pseudomonas mosselii]
MHDFDLKVFRYTIQFKRDLTPDFDRAALLSGIKRQLEAARQVVTEETLERIGHAQLAVMINTAARFNLSLDDLMMEAFHRGVHPMAPLCADVAAAKSGRRSALRPRLQVVK